MAHIEPCEVEELLGSCCNCEETPQGEEGSGENGGSEGGIDPDCGVPWGGVCDSNADCAGNFCCRNFADSSASGRQLHGAMVTCPFGEDECWRCWDCSGVVVDGCESCGSGEFDCDTCSVDHEYCEGGCTHGFACDPYSCGAEDYPPNGYHSPQVHGGCDPFMCGGHQHMPGLCECVPYDWYGVPTSGFCDNLPPWIPDYMECNTQQDHLIDTTPGACCEFSWDSSESRWVYDGCEIRPMMECLESSHLNVYWGIYTTCEEFQDCCGFQDDSDCVVNADCAVDYCCSDFGNCVTCASCSCQCLNSISEWECCEETEGNGIWHAGETCESYDCEEDCPEEPECGPGVNCPPCFDCDDGKCVPECQESSDCPVNRCCEDGCCVLCEPDCSDDGQCSGEQCCVNGSCTYNCPPEPECELDGECPGEQECEDGICVDPPDPPGCEGDGDCPQAQCCENGECVDCDPEPEEEDECLSDGDCGEGLCCISFPGGNNACFVCPIEDECACSIDGVEMYCDYSCDLPSPCEEGQDPDQFGLCYICRCCCYHEECEHQECY